MKKICFSIEKISCDYWQNMQRPRHAEAFKIKTSISIGITQREFCLKKLCVFLLALEIGAKSFLFCRFLAMNTGICLNCYAFYLAFYPKFDSERYLASLKLITVSK